MCIFTKTNHIHPYPIPAPCSMKPSRIKPTAQCALMRIYHPEVVREIEREFSPMLKDVKHIPAIFEEVNNQFPELSDNQKTDLFVYCAYEAYAKPTLVGQGVDRAPNGLRQEICKVMNWNHATSVNEVQDRVRVYFKEGSARTAFLPKVNAVMMGFERFSVKDNQLALPI